MPAASAGETHRERGEEDLGGTSWHGGLRTQASRHRCIGLACACPCATQTSPPATRNPPALASCRWVTGRPRPPSPPRALSSSMSSTRSAHLAPDPMCNGGIACTTVSPAAHGRTADLRVCVGMNARLRDAARALPHIRRANRSARMARRPSRARVSACRTAPAAPARQTSCILSGS